MQLTRVDSSMIYAAGYDETSQQMEVVFWNGIYRYDDVPREVFEGLLAAESKGGYMRGYVIDCYPYERLTGYRR